MNILVVDDDAVNRKVLRVRLESEGYSVIEASDGVEALTLMGPESISAVISDILMPRMDGYRLCHEMRKLPGLRDLRFILYSSTYTSPADVRLSTTVGADQFVAKPAPIEVILAALEDSGGTRKRAPDSLPDEALVLREYSAALVRKLEEKNEDLRHALDVSRRAHGRIHELNNDLERRVKERTAELVNSNQELTAAIAEVKQLNRLLPICSFCKSIRDDKDYWESVEGYIMHHTDSKFSHGVCPECYEKHYLPSLKALGLAETAEKSPT
jgi:CheY-like chemotaxis protein